MYLRLTEDEVALDDMFETFFSKQSSLDRVRAASPLGFDADTWGRLAETGAPGMALPEAVGGGGANLGDVSVAVNQLGRHIAPVPLVEHTVGGRLLASLVPDHPALPDIAAGSRTITMAINGPSLVPAGAVADLVLARVGDEIVLVDTPSPGAGPRNSADLPLADRSLQDGTAIGTAGWARATAEWQALMATALVGLGSRAVEIGVDYVKERHQFGVPVGSFQSVQHGLASAVTALDGARHLAGRGIWALDADQANSDTLAAMAFLFSAEAAQAGAAASLQYHGGYGFAEEYDIQLYYRRAKGWALQYGDPSVEYQRIATQLLPKAV